MRDILSSIQERSDERRARRLQREFGRRRGLLSWSRSAGAGRIARPFGPELSRTIERFGPVRTVAIHRAGTALDRSLPPSESPLS